MKPIVQLDEAEELGLGDILTLKCSLSVAPVCNLGSALADSSEPEQSVLLLQTNTAVMVRGGVVKALVLSLGKTYCEPTINCEHTARETVGKLGHFPNKCWSLVYVCTGLFCR